MTRLRLDGYLETDDPVVSACFLGKDAVREHCADLSGDDSPGYFDEDDEYHELPWKGTLVSVCAEHMWFDEVALDYPILIPTATVAEVAHFSDRHGSVICDALRESMDLDAPNEDYDEASEVLGVWLREHGTKKAT